MKPRLALVLLLLSIVPLSQAAITVDGGSTNWTPVAGDYDFDDQNNGQAALEIIGSGTNYGFLIGLENSGSEINAGGDLLFRIRLDSPDSGNVFAGVAWVGMDANLDGSIDVFVRADFSGNPDILGIHAPGTDLNISPSTTSITATPAISYSISGSNYSYRPVNMSIDGGTTNDGGANGNTDYYVSFMVPFADVVGYLAGLDNPLTLENEAILINDQSAVHYVVATSSSGVLNKDVGGIDGAPDANTRWDEQGGFSDIMTPGGDAVPEPSSGLLALGSLAFALLMRRR